jgi:ligand-binding SRPBCC domain-containing protein
MHTYKAEQFLPISLEKAWAFFSSPKNLSVITPPSMEFKILSNLEGEGIYEGMLIDYRVKPMLGIPVRWQTEISDVKENYSFTDEQLTGPYKIWKHTHTFTAKEDGVLMTDVIQYELPLGWLGKIVEKIIVRDKIKSIFDYRKNILTKIFA